MRCASSASTVPFYKEMKRKELVSTGEPVKIANLLEEIGISIEQATKYVCKKCAHKIANCHQLYAEIATVSDKNSWDT